MRRGWKCFLYHLQVMFWKNKLRQKYSIWKSESCFPHNRLAAGLTNNYWTKPVTIEDILQRWKFADFISHGFNICFLRMKYYSLGETIPISHITDSIFVAFLKCTQCCTFVGVQGDQHHSHWVRLVAPTKTSRTEHRTDLLNRVIKT